MGVAKETHNYNRDYCIYILHYSFFNYELRIIQKVSRVPNCVEKNINFILFISLLWFPTRSISGRVSEEGLGLSEQHRSLLAAAWTNNTAHPRLRDQILWEGTATSVQVQSEIKQSPSIHEIMKVNLWAGWICTEGRFCHWFLSAASYTFIQIHLFKQVYSPLH